MKVSPQLVLFFVPVFFLTLFTFGFLRYPSPTLPFFSPNPGMVTPKSPELVLALTFLVVSISFLSSIWIGVLAHELGHFIAGIFTRFKVQLLIIGPLNWYRVAGKWEFKLSPEWFLFGRYFGVPSDLVNLNFRFACLLIGGILGNAFVSITFLILMLSNNASSNFKSDIFGYERIFSLFLSIVFLTNFAITVINLLPLYFRKIQAGSDGFHLLRIIRNDPHISRDISSEALLHNIYQGIRPRDWNYEIVKAASLDEEDSDFVTAKYFAYSFFLDSGKIEAAGLTLDEAFAKIEHSIPENRTNLWLERAYFLSLYHGRIEEAQHCLEQVAPEMAWAMLQLRAEAAIAFSRQNWQEAKDKAQAALEDFKICGEPITARVEVEQIQDLLSRAEINLKMYI